MRTLAKLPDLTAVTPEWSFPERSKWPQSLDHQVPALPAQQ